MEGADGLGCGAPLSGGVVLRDAARGEGDRIGFCLAERGDRGRAAAHRCPV